MKYNLIFYNLLVIIPIIFFKKNTITGDNNIYKKFSLYYIYQNFKYLPHTSVLIFS